MFGLKAALFLLMLSKVLLAAQVDCTRGTNPYQGLKDKLNLVYSDFKDSAAALTERQVIHAKKWGKRAQREWEGFLKGSEETGLDVPTDLQDDVGSTFQILSKVSGENSGPTVGQLRRVAKRIEDYSMTLTCPD
jgi:hypothetical protein